MTIQPTTSPGEQAVACRPRRWRRRTGIVVAVISLLVTAWLLDGLPALLVTEKRWDQADYVLVLGSHDCLVEAAQRFREGRAKRVLLIGRYQVPIVRLGIEIPFEQRATSWLNSMGIPLDAIELIPAQTHDNWQEARMLEPWLANHSGAKIDVVSNRLNSVGSEYVLRTVLGANAARQLRVYGVPDPEIVERGWWRHRYSLKCVPAACLGLAFDYLHGPPSEVPDTWDPIAYVRALK